MNTYYKKYKKTMIAIHVAVWMVIILAPLTFFEHGDRMEPNKIIPMLSNPLIMMVVFYTMYLYITPRYLFSDDKRRFWLYSTLVVVGAGLLLHAWITASHSLFFKPQMPPHAPLDKHFHRMDSQMVIWFILRNIFSMFITAAVATMTVITMRWHKTEDARQEAELARQKAELARQEAEMARQEAELRNLRNQINPHFLLNTLNNIYALTAFDQTKAQQAIMELSGMLRHVLYDNQQEFVKLQDEVAFIRSYINLMKMRTSKTCRINVEVNIPEPCNKFVAPLIFISLIENAFKHGIAASGESFISISIKADTEGIECNVENSNHPKLQTDRSGHGIGLQQVQKRLELSYGNRFSWEKGTKENDSIYFSKIMIYDA